MATKLIHNVKRYDVVYILSQWVIITHKYSVLLQVFCDLRKNIKPKMPDL